MSQQDRPSYTPGMKEVIKLSKAEAGRLGHDYIGPEHYLLSIIRKGDGLAVQALNSMGVNLDELKEELERQLEVGKAPASGMPVYNEDAKRVMKATSQIAQEMTHTWIGTEHLLLGLIREGNTKASECLAQLNVEYEQAYKEVIKVITGGLSNMTKQKSVASEKSRTPALDNFGRDLTQLAADDKLDPVIGREDEIERILQILCRRTKNNPILLGEPGVGKTAIVEGLAQKNHQRRRPRATGREKADFTGFGRNRGWHEISWPV